MDKAIKFQIAAVNIFTANGMKSETHILKFK